MDSRLHPNDPVTGKRNASPRATSIFDVRTSDGRTIPIVCGEEATIDLHLLRFAHARLVSGVSETRVRSMCLTIALLHDFYLACWAAKPVRVEEFASLVAAFLRARRIGYKSPAEASTRIEWSPVMRSTVERDRQAIAEFSDFCAAHSAHHPLLPVNKAGVSAVADGRATRQVLLRAAATRDYNLLHHISGRQKPQPARVAGLPERFAHRGQRRGTAELQLCQVERIIAATPRPMHKMLLIEAFFGGPRLSEMLQQWRCDVLPGSMRKALFPDDRPSDLPVVILAHPSQATYAGDLHNPKTDRCQYLRQHYDLAPRNMIGKSPLAAGWKGMTFDNESLAISQIFWVNALYAKRFYELYRKVQADLYGAIPARIFSAHPYMYVNDAPGRKEFGEPLKLSNARKIFQRAYERVGLWPSSANGSHSARHYYKSVLEAMLSDRFDIQRCMHHLSVGSQDNYARFSSKTRARLYDLLTEAL